MCAHQRFPHKLWDAANFCKTGSVRWNKKGDSIIFMFAQFKKEFLDRNYAFCKSNKISSFVRQLNLYGFKKVLDVSKKNRNRDSHIFQNPWFIRGRRDQLRYVTRNSAVQKSKKGRTTKRRKKGRIAKVYEPKLENKMSKQGQRGRPRKTDQIQNRNLKNKENDHSYERKKRVYNRRKKQAEKYQYWSSTNLNLNQSNIQPVLGEFEFQPLKQHIHEVENNGLELQNITNVPLRIQDEQQVCSETGFRKQNDGYSIWDSHFGSVFYTRIEKVEEKKAHTKGNATTLTELKNMTPPESNENLHEIQQCGINRLGFVNNRSPIWKQHLIINKPIINPVSLIDPNANKWAMLKRYDPEDKATQNEMEVLKQTNHWKTIAHDGSKWNNMQNTWETNANTDFKKDTCMSEKQFSLGKISTPTSGKIPLADKVDSPEKTDMENLIASQEEEYKPYYSYEPLYYSYGPDDLSEEIRDLKEAYFRQYPERAKKCTCPGTAQDL